MEYVLSIERHGARCFHVKVVWNSQIVIDAECMNLETAIRTLKAIVADLKP